MNNIKATWKPTKTAEPITIYWKPYIQEHFSPSQQIRWGSFGSVQSELKKHIDEINKIPPSAIKFDLVCVPTAEEHKTREQSYGYSDCPEEPLVVRGRPLTEVTASVSFIRDESRAYFRAVYNGLYGELALSPSAIAALRESSEQALIDGLTPELVEELKKRKCLECINYTLEYLSKTEQDIARQKELIGELKRAAKEDK